MSCEMKLSLILLGLAILVVQIFCQESASSTQVGETNEVPAGTIIADAQSVQEPSTTEDKKLTKRSYGGWGPWGWPEYGYGWPWPGWGHGGSWDGGHGGWGHGGYGGHGGHGGHGGGWYGGWYGGHGWPWWYSGHGSGWHGKW